MEDAEWGEESRAELALWETFLSVRVLRLPSIRSVSPCERPIWLLIELLQ